MNKTKYLENGQKVILIQKIDEGGFLVKASEDFIEEGDWEVGLPSHSFMSTPFWVPNVYDIPFLDKLEAEAKKLKSEINDLKKGKSSLLQNERSKMFEEKRAFEKKMSKLRKYSDKFDDILLFIEDRVNYCIEVPSYQGGTYRIVEFSRIKQTKGERSYDRKDRMISLFGRGRRSEFIGTWSLSNYEDGSGGESHIIPFEKLEEAEAEFKRLLYKRAKSISSYFHGFVKNCEKYGVDLSGPKLEAYKKKAEEESKKREANKAKQRERLEAELERLKK